MIVNSASLPIPTQGFTSPDFTLPPWFFSSTSFAPQTKTTTIKPSKSTASPTSSQRPLTSSLPPKTTPKTTPNTTPFISTSNAPITTVITPSTQSSAVPSSSSLPKTTPSVLTSKAPTPSTQTSAIPATLVTPNVTYAPEPNPPKPSISKKWILIIVFVSIFGGGLSIATGLWVAKTLKRPSNHSNEYLEMESLVASSPIIQPQSADMFHQSIDSRTEDWQSQINAGRILSIAQQPGNAPARATNFGPNIPARLLLKKKTPSTLSLNDASDTEKLTNSDALGMQSIAFAPPPANLDWDPSFDGGPSDNFNELGESAQLSILEESEETGVEKSEESVQSSSV